MADERPTVAVLTLGCKLNQADSEAIARELGGAGVRVVDRPQRGAEAFVINSCSVTHVADRKARHMVRLARRLSPEARVILTGCYAETAPANIAELTGADAVIPSAEKASIPADILARLAERGDPAAGCPTHVGGGLRTRAFIKIQEGCNELCAFCIVPYTRGREVSVPVERVVQEVRAREAEGVLEVVLTGTQLGNYGRDLGWGVRSGVDPAPDSSRAKWFSAQTSFALRMTESQEQGPRKLLEALLAETSVPRIRLSSLQAQDISPELLRLWDDTRLCPHFHLPLQSGSETVLKAMRRRYIPDEFRRALALVRERVPDAAITTDVIAGFPGETDEDFEATYALCEEAGFAAMHCFPYSRRPQTGAAKMAGHLPAPTRRARLERLLALGRESSERFRRPFLGRTMEVLWEDRTADARWQGLTGNYMRVYTAADVPLANRILPTRLVGIEGNEMSGEVRSEAMVYR